MNCEPCSYILFSTCNRGGNCRRCSLGFNVFIFNVAGNVKRVAWF